MKRESRFRVATECVTVEKIIDEDGQEQESAPHPKQVLYVALSGEASVYDILRRQEGVTE